MLATARDLLVKEGPASITPTRLAAETGVSRSSIYRNWESPESIVLDAIGDDTSGPPFEATGDVRSDLTRYLQLLRDGLAMPHTTLLATRVDLAERESDAASDLRTTSENRSRLIAALLEQPPGRFADAHALIVGPLFFQRFLARRPISDELIALVVDAYIETIGPGSRTDGSDSEG